MEVYRYNCFAKNLLTGKVRPIGEVKQVFDRNSQTMFDTIYFKYAKENEFAYSRLTYLGMR